ncbi:MAG: hypothetical protein AAGC76_00250 [Luteibacter sp.]|nr:hypothetical protein [Luteibacter sp.]
MRVLDNQPREPPGVRCCRSAQSSVGFHPAFAYRSTLVPGSRLPPRLGASAFIGARRPQRSVLGTAIGVELTLQVAVDAGVGPEAITAAVAEVMERLGYGVSRTRAGSPEDPV